MNLNLKEEFVIAKRHPLSYGSFTNLIKILISYGGVDRKYILRTTLIMLICISGIPYRLLEKIIFGRKIEKTQIEQPPIFIVGHWRSGTTYFHNLMSKDPNLAYIPTHQAWSPGTFLLMSKTFFKKMISDVAPAHRPMDNVAVSPDDPQEEEWAIANVCHSSRHVACFPRGAREYFRNLDERQQKVQEEIWRKVYIRTCKTSTLAADGKRLLLKNPGNTTKIKTLLEMFPEAKFIHVYRNPYKVYLSRTHSFKTRAPLFRLQEQSEAESERKILKAYKRIMKSWFDNRDLIPKENVVEVKYEDFVGNEIAVLEKIYEQFNLTEFELAKTHFQEYLDSQENYKTNKYSLDEKTINKIYSAWQFTIDKWQYSPPQ